MEGKLIKHGHSYTLLKDGKMVAFAHPEDFSNDHMIGKLSLKNCEDIKCGFNLDELAEKRFGKSLHHASNRHSFREGFQKALEILGDKKFSEEKMKLFAEYVWKEVRSGRMKSMDELFNDWTSPQQTEWDVEIETEEKTVEDIQRELGTFGHDEELTEAEYNEYIKTNSIYKPKLDEDGCLILKRK